MQLAEDWRRILRHAWSVRLIILAALLSGIEAALPLFVDAIPMVIFAAATFLVTMAALVARFIAQKELPSAPPPQ